MTQNIYDNDEFFAGYLRLPRSVAGLEGAPEGPALRAMLPDLHGRTVLDLGCGFGWFCRWAREQGAAYVVGIDVSERCWRGRAPTRRTIRSATRLPIWSGSNCRPNRSGSSTARWRCITSKSSTG